MLQGWNLFKFLTEALHHKSHKYWKPHLLRHLGVWKGDSHQHAQGVADKPRLAFGEKSQVFPFLPRAKLTPCLHQWRNFYPLNLYRDLIKKTPKQQHEEGSTGLCHLQLWCLQNPQGGGASRSEQLCPARQSLAHLGRAFATHPPTFPTAPCWLCSLQLLRQRCLGFTAVNYSCLLLISCLQLGRAGAVTAWELLPMGFVPRPSLLPLPSSQPEHFILVTVPAARPPRTFEIKHWTKYSGEKREEKGVISAPQACKSRAFVMPLNVGHKSCPWLSKGTCLYDGNFHTCLAFFLALYCGFAAFQTL